MSPDDFLVAILPSVKEALRQFVEITNQTPDGLVLVAEEPSVCRIFATLHAEALETGLMLRLKALPPPPLEEERSGVRGILTPRLRKAASPPLPAPFLGWAAKYRCMKIAGTRFPLLHEEPESPSTSTHGSDQPITSVKPGPTAIP